LNIQKAVDAFQLRWLQLDSIGNDTTKLEPLGLECTKQICSHLAGTTQLVLT
jgi:hypothetical protein